MIGRLWANLVAAFSLTRCDCPPEVEYVQVWTGRELARMAREAEVWFGAVDESQTGC